MQLTDGSGYLFCADGNEDQAPWAETGSCRLFCGSHPPAAGKRTGSILCTVLKDFFDRTLK